MIKYANATRLITKSLVGSFTLYIGTIIYYRPLPDITDANHGESTISTAKWRTNASFCSAISPYFRRTETPTLLSLAQKITIGVTTVAIRIVINTFGKFRIS